MTDEEIINLIRNIKALPEEKQQIIEDFIYSCMNQQELAEPPVVEEISS